MAFPGGYTVDATPSWLSVVAILLGVGSIIVSILPGGTITPALTFGRGPRRPTTWVDRALFFLVGVFVLVMGLASVH